MTLCVVKFVSILVCLFFTIMHVVVSLETPTVTGPSLIEGERVSITCENRLANGNATLVWSRSDQNGVELPGIYKTEQIATTDIWLATNTHDITPDRNMNQNPSLKYRCTASFNGEEKHTDWSVFVFVKPTGPEITSSNVVAAGQVATLTCQATNANPVAVITWRIGSMDYKTTSVTTANGDSTYNVVRTLSHTFTAADNGTIVYCDMTHSVPNSVRTVSQQLIVQYAPNVTVTSTSYTVSEGQSVTLICNVTSQPSANNVAWTKDGAAIDRTSGRFTNGNSVSQPSLTITNVQATDLGTYVCTATNSIATAHSPDVTLNVKYSPQNMRTIPLNSTEVTEGDTAVFQCLADSFPAASFRWTKGSTQLADTANLTIQVVSPDNSGQLTCTATNSKGSDTVDLRVVVNYIPRPDKAYSIVATFVGQAATLTCSTHGVPPVTKYGWKYANKTLSETGQTLTITPTSSSAAYFGVYICSATNAVGTSEDILIVLQETKPTEPPNAGASTGGGGLSSALIALIALIVAVIIVAIILVLCCCYKQGVCSKVFHKKKAGKGRVGPSGRKGMTAVETPHLTSTQKPITGYGYVSSDSRNPSSTAVSRKDVDIKYNDVNHFRTPAERKIILEDEDDRNILIPNGTGPIISCENKPYQLPPIDHTPVEDISEKKKKRKKRRRYKREEQLPHSDNQEEQRVENDYVTPAHTYSSVA